MMHYRIPAPNVKEFSPEVYQCRRATCAPCIDGDLDKPFWQSAEWTNLFADIEGDIRPKPRFDTRAKMVWDDAGIYFGAELIGNEIWSYVTGRDSVIFYDNDFEIFIDPDSDTQCYAEFEMNAANVVWDLLLTKAYRDGGKAINSFDIKGLQTATKIYGKLNDAAAENTKWTCEVFMPFYSLAECGARQDKPHPGDFWRVGFSRVQWLVDIIDGKFVKRTNPETGRHYPEDNWVWAPTGIVNMHYPELWGFVFFCGNNESYAIPEDEKLKWELRRLYYAQHAHYDENGRFTADLSKLKLQTHITPTIHVTPTTFEISCPSADNKHTLHIYTDGKTTKIKN